MKAPVLHRAFLINGVAQRVAINEKESDHGHARSDLLGPRARRYGASQTPIRFLALPREMNRLFYDVFHGF